MKGMRVEGGYGGWRVVESGERKAPNSLQSKHLEGYEGYEGFEGDTGVGG
jgi:hypothetical protein